MTTKTDPNPLEPVAPTSGQPLYKTVQDYLVTAIKRGHYQPGQQIPSTKELSRQMSVSLVTAHRALQELVSSGILERSQGRGTFVVEGKPASAKKMRLGLVLHPEASMADFYHSQLLEGMRQGCREEDAELMILQFGEHVRDNCDGFLLVNPRPDEIDRFAQKHAARKPTLVVGARSNHEGIYYIDVDNVNLAQQAVEHLHRLGHTRIAYLGSIDDLSNSRDRRAGFAATCDRLKIPDAQRTHVDASGWRLTESETMALNRLLASKKRPTALLAGGYYLSLDAYAAAAVTGLRIPDDLTIVGVDDPPSAVHLSPPMTTISQPLTQLGLSAVTAISEYLNHDQPLHNQTLRPNLIIRESSGAPCDNVS